MKRRWEREDLELNWGLLPSESKLLRNKSGATRLGFMILLKFFQLEGRFPTASREIPEQVVIFVSEQTQVPPEAWQDYPWEGITIRRHRAEIRKWTGFREATVKDAKKLESWLLNDVLPTEQRDDRLREAALNYCRNMRIEPPGPERLKRHIRSAAHVHETRFSEGVYQQLSSSIVERLEKLLKPQAPEDGESEWTPWQNLKADPGKAGVESVKETAARLRLVREVGLPANLFAGVSKMLLERYAKRASVEAPFELRRHGRPLQVTIIAAFLHHRSRELTDHLVDLLVEIIHKMGKRAEKKVEEKLSGQFQKVPGKLGVLVRMAEACLNTPEGVVNQVIYPVVSEELLKTILQEIQNSGPAYHNTVRIALKRSYQSHYRRMASRVVGHFGVQVRKCSV